MTFVHARPPADRLPAEKSPRGADRRSRICFRQPVSTAGFIDAAWWPRTHDLTVEVPPLMDVLWTADRNVNRVTYHMRSWDPAPRRMQVEGRTVRLGGFTVGDPYTVSLSDPWGHDRVDILVIASDTGAAHAQRIFDVACVDVNRYRSFEILDLAAGADHDGPAGR